MSTTIRATCPVDGDVRITSADVVVRTLIGETTGQYRFVCPTCRELIIKDASERIVEVLVNAGVKLEVFSLPLELRDANRTSDRPVVSLDEVLEIHEALEKDDFIERLTWGNK